MKKNLANSVDAYIANCPNEVQDELRNVKLPFFIPMISRHASQSGVLNCELAGR